MKLEPRNESEFRDEVRDGLMRAFPGRCLFQITHSVSGEPDTYIRIADVSFRAEFKFTTKPFQTIRSIEDIWKMLRKIQQVTILNMAARGELIYVVVCCGGNEAPWFRIDGRQAIRALAGKAPAYTVLALERLSERRMGAWSSGLDWGDDMPEKKSLARHLLTRLPNGFRSRPA